MNPIYSAAIAAIAAAQGKRIHCPACGKVQIISRHHGIRPYRCKRCAHVFKASELQKDSEDRG